MMDKEDLVRDLWLLVRTHKSGPHCKSDCSLRGELRSLLKMVEASSRCQTHDVFLCRQCMKPINEKVIS